MAGKRSVDLSLRQTRFSAGTFKKKEIWIKLLPELRAKLIDANGKCPGLRVRVEPWKSGKGYTIWLEFKVPPKWNVVASRKIALHQDGTINYFPDGSPPVGLARPTQEQLGKGVWRQGPVPA